MAKTDSTVSETPTKSTADLKKLFAEYDASNKKIQDARASLDKAMAARSAAVAAICAGAGGRKGPFRHPVTGMLLSAVERKETSMVDGVKTSTGNSRWLFKGPTQ